MLNILYIGPNESEWAQEHCAGSLAAAKWARGFLGGLSKVAKVTALTHTYYYPWPKGRLVWSARDDRLYPSGWDCEVVSYPVLKYIRDLWWRIAYPRMIRRILASRKIDLILFYNCCEPWQIPVMRAIRGCGVKVFPIILDGPDPRRDNWRWIKRASLFAEGFVSLSWWVYQNLPKYIPGVRSLHFDGGADGWCGTPPSVIPSCNQSICQSANSTAKPFTLVHTGALDQWRGLDFMIKLVQRYVESGVKFIFCGKSSCERLKREFGSHPHVELSGYVSEERMNALCCEADVLLNVRDPNHPDNILNYPSKLPHYLSFGRPIVSTRLKSLAPNYDQVVHFAADDSVDAFVKQLDMVRSWSLDRKLDEYNRIKSWFEQHKTWDVMTRRLVCELDNIV